MLIAAGYGDTRSESRVFRVFPMTKLRVGLIAAVIALVLALLPLGLLCFVRQSYAIAGADYKLRMLFLDPETDTYSLSKLQFYLWTVASLFGYAYLFISHVKIQYLPWPDVPGTLPGIIAVAAGTAVGSQLITASKGSKGAGEEKPNFADFITSGGVAWWPPTGCRCYSGPCSASAHFSSPYLTRGREPFPSCPLCRSGSFI